MVTFVPFAAYYVARYPDWSWMYLFPSTSLPGYVTYGALAVYVAAVWAGFELTGALLKAGQLLPARLNAIGDLVILGVITVWGWHRLMFAGPFEEYQAGSAPLIFKTPLFWAVAAMGVVFVPALLFMLRRTRESRPKSAPIPA